MAESGTLLRCYTRKGIGGSNPPLSASKSPDWIGAFLFPAAPSSLESGREMKNAMRALAFKSFCLQGLLLGMPKLLDSSTARRQAEVLESILIWVSRDTIAR